MVICHVCDAPPIGQCQRCGKFYCRKHGDVYCQQCRPREAAIPGDPQFLHSDEGVRIVVAPVSGFQELMSVLKALDVLPERKSAHAVRFLNGEASYQFVPQDSVSLRALLDAVAQATNEELSIEEFAPDAQRLRLRVANRLHADPRTFA